MPIQDERLTVTIKENPNNKVTVKTKENLGVNAVHGDAQVGARVLGIEGKRGPDGAAGEVGLNWTGQYDSNTEYSERDGVFYFGNSYLYIHPDPTTGNSPPDPTYWDVFAAGGTSGDKSYVHIQGASTDTWTIVHNLGKFPSVSIIDSGNSEVIGDIEYIDATTVVARFSGAFSGRAYCN